MEDNSGYEIHSYPNKSIALKSSGFIFRSDSNAEDLEGFAGAGLFDSIPLTDMSEERMEYHKVNYNLSLIITLEWSLR